MRLLSGLMSFALASSAVLMSSAAFAAEEVNIYSARKEALIKPLLDKFSEKTGVTVNLVTGKADALLKRLQSEGANSPADLFLTTDAGRLQRAKNAGVLKAVDSEALKATVPSQYRDKEDMWYGLSLRARVVVFDKEKVKAEDLSTYEALTDEKWKGKICIRSSSNIYNQSLMASIIDANGAEKAGEWAKGIVTNMARKPAGGDRDQVKAVATGQCTIAVVNTYYLGAMLGGKKADQKAAAEKVTVFWPNQDGRGTHVNVSGIGLTTSAKNTDNAVKLMEFLASEEAQQWYAAANYEFPVKAGIDKDDIVKSWGEFKADTIDMSKLGELNPDAVKLMDKAGWK